MRKFVKDEHFGEKVANIHRQTNEKFKITSTARKNWICNCQKATNLELPFSWFLEYEMNLRYQICSVGGRILVIPISVMALVLFHKISTWYSSNPATKPLFKDLSFCSNLSYTTAFCHMVNPASPRYLSSWGSSFLLSPPCQKLPVRSKKQCPRFTPESLVFPLC